MAFFIDDIILSPVYLVKWIGEKLVEVAESEIGDASKVQTDLLTLQMQLEMDEISLEEYDKREAVLLERLEELRKDREAR